MGAPAPVLSVVQAQRSPCKHESMHAAAQQWGAHLNSSAQHGAAPGPQLAHAQPLHGRRRLSIQHSRGCQQPCVHRLCAAPNCDLQLCMWAGQLELLQYLPLPRGQHWQAICPSCCGWGAGWLRTTQGGALEVCHFSACLQVQQAAIAFVQVKVQACPVIPPKKSNMPVIPQPAHQSCEPRGDPDTIL